MYTVAAAVANLLFPFCQIFGCLYFSIICVFLLVFTPLYFSKLWLMSLMFLKNYVVDEVTFYLLTTGFMLYTLTFVALSGG